MKSFLKYIFITSIAIWVTTAYVTGLSYGDDLKTLLLAGIAFALINFFAKPIIKIIMLPINIVTLGIFSWVINVIVLYLTVVFVSGFTISPFTFPGIHYNGLVIPNYYLSTLWAAVTASLSISIIINFLRWILD